MNQSGKVEHNIRGGSCTVQLDYFRATFRVTQNIQSRHGILSDSMELQNIESWHKDIPQGLLGFSGRAENRISWHTFAIFACAKA